MNLYIDFGGTNFRYCLDNEEIYTQSSKDIDLKSFLDNFLPKHEIEFIGISYAGQVENGEIISAPNIKMRNFKVKEYVKERYKIDLEIDNDLNCAALAENELVSAKMLAVLYIGTGFGSAFVYNGNLIQGSHNFSGEIGHIPFQSTPFQCGCGRRDCLELSTSGSSIEKWGKHFGLNLPVYSLENFNAIKREDADFIYENFYKGLALGFHTILNLFDPDTIVLGGSVVKNSSEKVLSFLTKEQGRASFHRNRKKVDIKISSLQEGSLKGAKLLKGRNIVK